MLVNPIDATLKDTKEPFNRVRMSITPYIFPGGMTHNVMFSKIRAEKKILSCIIGHKMGIVHDLLFKNGLQSTGGNIGNMERPNLTITLNKEKNSVFMALSTYFFAQA